MLTEGALRTIFEKTYDRADWYTVLRQNFFVETLRATPADITARIANNEYGAKAFELGDFETPNGQLIGLYEVAVPLKAQLHRNRKALRDLLSNVYRNDVEAALVVFVQGNKWRFTYVSEIAVRDAAGKRTVKATDPKRHTYLFGEKEKALTAARQFSKLRPGEDMFSKGLTLEALQEAFNVEMRWWLIFKFCTPIQNGYQLIWKYFSQIPIAPTDNKLGGFDPKRSGENIRVKKGRY